MPESVFTQTMPFAFAGGAWCSLVVALVEAFDELPELDGEAVLLAEAESSAGDDVDDDALGDDVGAVLRDAELPAGDAACALAESGFSVALDFFDRLFFVVASELPGVSAGAAVLPAVVVFAGCSVWVFFDGLFFGVLVSVPLSDADVCDASEFWFFLVRLFLVVLVSAAVVPLESALVLFWERLFFAVPAESLEATASALAVVFFLDLDFGFESSAAESVPLGEVSGAAFFFALFFLVVVLLSLWPLGVGEPVCCAPRAFALPKSSNVDAKTAKSTRLLDLI